MKTAHPETLKIVQTIHDTLYVVVRDTVVRVAEPFHDHMQSGPFSEHGFLGIFGAAVTLVAGLVTIVLAGVALWAYIDARRTALGHVASHIAIARNWIQGRVVGGPPTGWRQNDITPRVEFAWRHPRNIQVPLFSGSAFSQVTLLQNVFLPRTLTPHLATVAQSVEAFNDAIAQYNTFRLSAPLLYVAVARKLDGAVLAMFPEGAPDSMTRVDLNTILANANLTPEEAGWSENLFRMLQRAHVVLIGSAPGTPMLFQRVQALEAEFDRTTRPS